MRKFISMTPLMLDASGHHYTYFTAIHKAASLIGIQAITVIPKKCNVKLDKSWKREFGYSKNRWFRALINLYDYCRIVFKLRKEEVTILYECTVPHLFEIVIASLCFHKKGNHVWLFFRDTIPENTIKRWWQKNLSKILMLILRDDLTFVTDSELIAKTMKRLVRKSVHTLPIPHAESFSTKENYQPKKNSRLLLWLPGCPSQAKGLEHLRTLLFSKDPKAQQMTLMISERARNDFDNIPLSTMHICFLKEVLSIEEYTTVMARADFIVLPYSPKTYIHRTSGVFTETIVAGKIPFVKAGSWLAYELLKYDLGDLIVDWDDPYLPSKMLDLSQNPSILNKLSNMQRSYKEYHSITNFARKMWKIIQSVHF